MRANNARNVAKNPHSNSDFDDANVGQFASQNSTTTSTRKNDSLTKTAVFLYCLTVFLLPFVFLPFVGFTLQTSKILIIALLLSSAGIIYLFSERGKQIKIPRTLFTYLGVFMGVIAVSTLFSESFSASFVGLFQGGSFYLLILGMIIAGMGSLIISTPGRLLALFVSFFAGVVVLALIHVVRLVGGPEIFTFGVLTTSTSTLAGSWYDLGVIFGVTYIISLSGILFKSLPSRLNTFLSLLLFVSVFFLVITHLTILLILLSFFGGFVLLLSLKSKVHKGKILALITTLILVASIIFSPQINTQLGEIFGIEYVEVRPRWESTLEIARENLTNPKTLLVGNGPNTFSYMWQDDRGQEVVESDFWNIDFVFGTSTFATFILTLGIFAGVLIFAWLSYFVVLILRLRQNESIDSFTYMSMHASLLAALLILIFGFFYVFGSTLFLLLCVFSGVAMGMFARMRPTGMSSLRLDTESGSYVFGIFVIIFSLIGAHVIAMGVSSLLYSQAMAQTQSIDSPSDFEAIYSKLGVARFLDRNDRLERAKAELALLEMQFLSSLDEAQITEEIQNRFIQAIEVGTESALASTRIDPRNYLNWITGGYVFETLGELGIENGHIQAASYYAQARVEHPTNPEIPLIQARLEQAIGNTERARAFIRESIEMKKSYINAYALLAQTELAVNNEAKALSALEEGILANPRSRILHYELGILHYRLENFNRAVDAFSSAIESDPNYANALYFRGLAHLTLGNKEESLADLEKVLATNEENQDLIRVINNIRADRSPFIGVNRGEGASLPEVGDATTDSGGSPFNGGATEEVNEEDETENFLDDEEEAIEEQPVPIEEDTGNTDPLTEELE
jgi:tetratricopeptide (TPR) repeat protein